MDVLRDADIDPAPLAARKVAVIGFGNQGRPQALNLRDSGIDVRVGLRPGSARAAAAAASGLRVVSPQEAASEADLVMLLVPDEVHGALYIELEPHLRRGAALGFSHGLSIHFNQVRPRADLDVFLLAPKGPGTALRALYQQGQGMVALWAVAQDATGAAGPIALAYGRAIGCGRAGLLASSFAEECEADLFNEHAVVWGAVPELLRAGFETLVEAGIAPEVAYMECVGELKLIADLIEARGIAGMREAISNTAELGAVLGGARIVTGDVRTRMREVLDHIRAGRFAAELQDEWERGYPLLRAERELARASTLEETFQKLRGLSPSD